MNALEHQLDYPLGDTLPAGGIRHQVAPGIYWLRMPLPFALDHINLWLLRDRQDGQDGWTIVDCGINHEAIRAYWKPSSPTGSTACPCCACWSRTAIPTTSACRAGCAKAATTNAGTCACG